jgi:hypothetical protein
MSFFNRIAGLFKKAALPTAQPSIPAPKTRTLREYTTRGMPMTRSGFARARDPEPVKPRPPVRAQRPQPGYRFGSDHPQARLIERDVELMRQLHEEYPVGDPRHLGYRRLARIFGVAKTTVRQAVNYKTWTADGRIDALNQAVESAVDHDNADKRAAFLVETAAKVKLVADLAEARIKVAAVVDEKFVELKKAFRALLDASNVIEHQVRQIVRVRDEGLDPSRRGEKIAVAMLHASGDSPAMMEALGQSVNSALPSLATSGLIEIKAPIGDPARAHLTLAAAADVAAHGLRQRLLSD